jgi:hypothetical protein
MWLQSCFRYPSWQRLSIEAWYALDLLHQSILWIYIWRIIKSVSRLITITIIIVIYTYTAILLRWNHTQWCRNRTYPKLSQDKSKSCLNHMLKNLLSHSGIDRDPGQIPVPAKIGLFFGIPVPVKIAKFTGIGNSTGIVNQILKFQFNV